MTKGKKLLPLTLLFFSHLVFAQAPDLGSAAGFVLFSSKGTVSNTGASYVTGNVGTRDASSTGFGNVNGVMHNKDSASAVCVSDLQKAYNKLNTITFSSAHLPFLGNGESLKTGVYFILGNTSLNQVLTLDAQTNANAVFIFKVQGTFSSIASAKINLINGAQACNVFWKIEGKVSLASGTVMKGTVIANNAAISMAKGASLEGRAFSTAGNITVSAVSAYIPTGCRTPLLTGPAAPIFGSAIRYSIYTSNGTVNNRGITSVKGDVGTNVGLTAGYNPSKVSGVIHSIPDSSTAKGAADLLKMFNYLNNLPADIELLYPSQFGYNLVLTPHTYLLNTAATLTDTLYLNAQGNTNGIFVLKVNGALSTGKSAKVILLNGAQAGNVFWVVDGGVNLNSNTGFKGTIICNGAVNLNTGTELLGRAFTTNGALNTTEITAIMQPQPITTHDIYIWNGGSGDWNEASNWTTTSKTGIPSGCAADVIIPSGSPSISTAVSAGSVSISSSVHLSVKGSLRVCGNFIVSK